MTEYRFEVSPEFPQGRLVPLTDAEVAQRAASRAVAQTRQAERDRADVVAATITARLASLLDDAETSERTWATLTAGQKVEGALRTSLRMNIALARLLLRRLDNP